MENSFQRSRFLASLEISTKPPSFYQHAVKVLYFPDLNGVLPGLGHTSNIDCARILLPVLTGVTNIFCWIKPRGFDPQLADAFAALRPKRVSAHFGGLLYHPNHNTPNFAIPFFSQVTHLEAVDFNWYGWSGFELMPRLTHLRVPISDNVLYRDHSLMKSTLEQILAGCVQLRVCVVEISAYSFHEEDTPLTSWVLDDHRVVWTVQEDDSNADWMAFKRGEPDTWHFADARVTEQEQLHRCMSPCKVYYEEEEDW